MFDNYAPRPIPQYQSLKHGTTVREFMQEHMPNNPMIVIVGLHSGTVFYDGKRNSMDGPFMNMTVRMAHPSERKYAYCMDYEGDDGNECVYKIVVNDEEEA